MNDEQRARLRTIAELVAALGAAPTAQNLGAILQELDALISQLQTGGYPGIELTALRMMRAILVREVGSPMQAGPLGAAAKSAVALACRQQAMAMNWLAKAPKDRPAQPDEKLIGPPAATLMLDSYVVDAVGIEFIGDEETGQKSDLRETCLTLGLMRDAGVQFLDFGGLGELTPQEFTWVCNAAKKSILLIHATPHAVTNMEICGPNGVTIYARLVISKNRTRVWISCESRTLQRVLPGGKSVAQVKTELIREFKLKSIEETEGGVWKLTDLLELQAAFTKIPGPDRGALQNLVLLRKREADKKSDESRELGSYQRKEHVLTLLDLTFDKHKAFIGGGRDPFPFCHSVILHEVGHCVEEWYQVQGVPFSTVKVPRKDTCLGLFLLEVKQSGIEAFTEYAQKSWPDKPYEFFAEAYTIFLNDPAAMEFMSPSLLEWFRHGRYRVGRGVDPSAGQAFNPAQTTALQALQLELEGIGDTLAAAKDASASVVTGLRASCNKMLGDLSLLIQQVKADGESIECTTLILLHEVLTDTLGAQLGTSAAKPPSFADFPRLRLICEAERATVVTLLKPAQAAVPVTAKSTRVRHCLVVARTDGGPGGVLIGDEDETTFTLVPPTRSLTLLRERGFRKLHLQDCEALQPLEVALLCNVARKVYADCGSRLGLNVNVSVTLPDGRVFFVRLSFFVSGTLRIRLAGIRLAGAPQPAAPSRQVLLETLRKLGLGEVQSSPDAAWTDAELAQVCEVFTKIPAADLTLLRGCNLLRKKMAGGSSVPLADHERRNRGSYQQGTHTLVFLNSTFVGVEHGFVHCQGVVQPYTYRNVAQLVGLAFAAHAAPGAPNMLMQFALGLDAGPVVETETGWEARPEEFFAAYYGLWCIQPSTLGWVSPSMLQWFDGGDYRTLLTQ